MRDKRNYTLRLTALLLTLLCSCATDPSKVAITPESQQALVLVAVDSLRVETSVSIAHYDPVLGALDSSLLEGGAYAFNIPLQGPRTYVAQVVKPGKYAFVDVIQQGIWAVCFHERTLSFEVQPGEIAYLGFFDQRPHIRQLQELVTSSGKRESHGELVQFFDGIIPPKITPSQASELSDVSAYIKTAMPMVVGTPKIVSYEPAKFGTGSDAFGERRLCNGYYKKNANQ